MQGRDSQMSYIYICIYVRIYIYKVETLTCHVYICIYVNMYV